MPIPPVTRTMQKSDYETIYKLIAAGTPREVICSSFGIKSHTLWMRLTKDRPDLARKTKMMPTRKRVLVDPTRPLVQVVQERGKRVIDGLTRITEHEVEVMSGKVDRQALAAERDPNFQKSHVALKDSKDLLNIVKVAGMIPGFGIDNGGAKGGTQVNVSLNHATVMRINGKGIFAEEIPAAALVEVPALNDVINVE